jgi:uncharacterized Zn finger protein
MWYSYRPYVPAARRKAEAANQIKKRQKKGEAVSPVILEGKAIARTFWGKSWCQNLESYSDYSNRLPRGRSYVRNGSVVDLQIFPGEIKALVSGSSLYEVAIKITSLPNDQWRKIKSSCAGEISSLIELLQGKLSKGVMDVVTAKEGGLFPKPREIKLSCSCPDWAGMCKHVAAVMYGVGARLDHQPELLFRLREVDHLELIESAVPTAGAKSATGKTLVESELADVFGIEFAQPETEETALATSSKTTTADRTADARTGKPTPMGGKPGTMGKRSKAERSAAKRKLAASKRTAANAKPRCETG